jgi:hypothetical protein
VQQVTEEHVFLFVLKFVALTVKLISAIRLINKPRQMDKKQEDKVLRTDTRSTSHEAEGSLPCSQEPFTGLSRSQMNNSTTSQYITSISTIILG